MLTPPRQGVSPGKRRGTDPSLQASELGPLDDRDSVVDVDYVTRKFMGKSSRTPAGAKWLWKFVARLDVCDDGQFTLTGDKFQGGFDYTNSGSWSGPRDPVEFYEMSLADTDEEKAHAQRLYAAQEHYNLTGRQYSFQGTSFQGRFYKGMPIGACHEWQYEDAKMAPGVNAHDVSWKETKVNVDRWLLDVSGSVEAGNIAAGSYLLIADQIATRLDEKCNAYNVAMQGQLHRLGDAFSKDRRDQLLRLYVARKQKVAPAKATARSVSPKIDKSQKTLLSFFKKPVVKAE